MQPVSAAAEILDSRRLRIVRRLPRPALPARLVPLLVLLVTATVPLMAQGPPPEPAPAPTPAAPPASTSSAPAAQPKATYTTRRTADRIAADGVLDEPVWQGPPTFTLDYETYPADNLPPPVRTEYWVTYDDRNLYVAVRAHDPQPALIRARLRDRDNAFRDDFVGIVLDTFNDERRAFEFFVNPLGVQMDLFQNDVSGGEDESWDALWATGGRVTSTGYEVEMAIPFSSLRFPRASGPMIWGVDAVRIWPRDQRRRIGLNRQERGRNCYLCQEAKLVGIEGVTPGRNLELDPTLTANQTESRPDPGTDFDSKNDVEGGLTGRWGVTPGLTLNGTLNPDFSQVEADAAQLAVNTQFALFYPEKRPFFLEGADIFQTRINAVYTRTIADPDWGFKVSGKQGNHAFGAIVARDQRTNLVLPSSQSTDLASLDEDNLSAILRYRRDLPIGSGSALGGLYTDRSGTDYHNRVAGIDSLIRWGEGEAFRIEALGSETRYPTSLARSLGQPEGDFRGHAVRAVFQHNARSWGGYLLYHEVTEEFRADLGFVPQADFRNGYGFLERYLYGEEGKQWYSRITYGTESTWTYDHDGNPLQRQVSPYLYVNGPRESFFQLYLGLGNSFFAGRSFDRNYLDFTAEVQANSSVFLHVDGRVGQEIDFANARQGRVARFTPRVRLDVGRHLRLDLSDTHQTLDVHGGRLFRVDLAELRATYQLDVRSFLRVISQYQDLRNETALFTFSTDEHSRDLFNQLLFSYKLNPQTVLFLGYSDGYFGGDRAGSWLSQSDRTFFAKVGYAFVW